MKPLLLSLMLAVSFHLQAQVPYNVVFDLTSKDTNDHKMVMRWMTEISKEHPDAKLEVVLFGQSLDMIRKDRSTVAASIAALTANPNISVTVCAAALKRMQVPQDQLLPQVKVVPDGIYEIVTRQKEGWGYIKAAH